MKIIKNHIKSLNNKGVQTGTAHWNPYYSGTVYRKSNKYYLNEICTIECANKPDSFVEYDTNTNPE